MSRRQQGWTAKLLGIILGVVLLPLLLPLVLLIVCLIFLSRLAVHLLICVIWMPQGKDVLYVYSDSPTWHDYMQNEVLPLVVERAVILNWSRRHSWSRWSLATWAFGMISGHSNYNPLVVLYRPLRRSRQFRFWAAFQEKKHGNTTSVEELKTELSIALNPQAVRVR